MGLNRDIRALLPEAKEKAEKMLFLLGKKGIRVMINETLRTHEVQQAYLKQGRRPLIEVNAARIASGLWAISEKENMKPVTWTDKSKHLEGKAIDIVPLTLEGKPWWSAPFEVWESIGIIGESVGFKWGGRWKGRQDCPHFEIP